MSSFRTTSARRYLPRGHFTCLDGLSDRRATRRACPERSRRSLYARARAGEIADFTGVSAPYEPPNAPDLVVDTVADDVETCVGQLFKCVTGKFGRGRVKGGGMLHPIVQRPRTPASHAGHRGPNPLGALAGGRSGRSI